MLTGQAKRDYQRKYMRQRRREEAERTKIARSNAMGLLDPTVRPNTPLYNPSIHRAGDMVRVLRGKREIEIVIPELDADGSPMY